MSSVFGQSLLAAASLVALATPAFAQDNPPENDRNAGGVEEIIVTAQKREQNLQDVPVAVTAFSAATINRLGLSSTEDLAGLHPTLIISLPAALVRASASAVSRIRISPSIRWALLRWWWMKLR